MSYRLKVDVNHGFYSKERTVSFFDYHNTKHAMLLSTMYIYDSTIPVFVLHNNNDIFTIKLPVKTLSNKEIVTVKINSLVQII